MRRTAGTDLARDQDLPCASRSARSARSAIPVVAVPRASAGLFGRGGARRPSDGRDVRHASACRSSAALLIALERGALAGHDHRDLPRGRHPQAAARDAAAAAHDPDRARARQAAATAVTLVADDRWPAARYYPVGLDVPVVGVHAGAAAHARCSILSIGFVIASIVPTARFAQPIGALVLYPMLGAVGAVRAGRGAAAGAAGWSRSRCR